MRRQPRICPNCGFPRLTLTQELLLATMPANGKARLSPADAGAKLKISTTLASTYLAQLCALDIGVFRRAELCEGGGRMYVYGRERE